jgi:cytidylate kinase
VPDPKRGRPPLTPGAEPARVQVRVSAPDYDRAYQIAQRDGVSLAQVLRRGLRRELAADDDAE